MEMEYRRLGRSGLKVSVLSFGSWVTFGPQLDEGLAADCLGAAREAGVNFFDNAESYSGGESERIMGKALARLGWPRHSYVLSTKLYWGIHGDEVNMHNTLNRKYLSQAIEGSLERFDLIRVGEPVAEGDLNHVALQRRGEVGGVVRPEQQVKRGRVVPEEIVVDGW